MGKGDAYPVPGHLVGLEGKVQGDRRKLHAMAGCQDVKYGLRYSLCAASKICMKRVALDCACEYSYMVFVDIWHLCAYNVGGRFKEIRGVIIYSL